MNAKAILRVGMNFVRRNDTKLIAIGAGILGIITTTIAVKSGMKANEALNEAEENLADETFEEEALSDIDAILDAAAQAAGTGEEA